MPSQRSHTTQSRKHARKAVPARFGIRGSAFAIRPARQNCGNGTISHTTGSDKTSPKGEARRVSSGSANQFNKIHEGCVEENTNTGSLVRRLLFDDNADQVIVCTLEKFDLAKNDLSE